MVPVEFGGLIRFAQDRFAENHRQLCDDFRQLVGGPMAILLQLGLRIRGSLGCSRSVRFGLAEFLHVRNRIDARDANWLAGSLGMKGLYVDC